MSAHVYEELSAYLDGQLADAEAERVRRHLDACAACRAELEALQATVQLLRSLPEEEPPAGLRPRVLARVRQQAARRAPWRRVAAWAAAAAVAAAAVGFALRGGAELPSVAERVPTPGGAQVGVPAEERTVPPGAPGAAVATERMAAAPPPAPLQAAEAVKGAGPSPAGPADLGRKVALSAQLRLEAADVEATARAAEDAARALGGLVQEAVVERGERAGARLVLRVPAARFPELDRRLQALGRVRERRVWTEDVTGPYVDAESRLRTLRAQELHLLGLLERARTVDETLRVEQELWRVRGEIETLTGQLRAWDRMVELATVQVEVVPPGSAAPPPGSARDRLRRAAQQAADAALTAVEAMLVGAGFLAPWTLLAAAGWWAYRRLRGPAPPGPAA